MCESLGSIPAPKEKRRKRERKKNCKLFIDQKRGEMAFISAKLWCGIRLQLKVYKY
jgi:hypothetical protein